MPMRVVRVSLTVDVSVYAEQDLGVSDEEIREQLERRLRDWNDGRHLFSVEQIHDGVRRNVEAAVENVVDRQVRDRYPYNPQRLGQGPFVGNTLVSKRVRGLSVNIYGGRMTVPSVEEVSE